MLPVRIIGSGTEPPHRSRTNRETHSFTERQARGTGGQPNLRGRSEPHPSARHLAGLEDGYTQDFRPGTWIPRQCRCRRNGKERKGHQERTPYPFALWKEQETLSCPIERCGHPLVRHSGCGGSILYLHQHHALCDGSLCGKQQAPDCYRPPQPLRLCGRSYP